MALSFVNLVGTLLYFASYCRAYNVEKIYRNCSISVGQTCCQETIQSTSKTVRSCEFTDEFGLAWCTSITGFTEYGCHMNHLPDVGVAHPLGMQSGKIKKFQLSSYAAATQESLTKARLFGPDGWRPDDRILVNPSNVEIPGTSLSQILSSPIFFQITFEKMKKISYFVIQDSPPSQSMRYSQSFYIAYNDAEWKTYGGSKAQELRCEYIFGHIEQSCRHIFSKPFRANSVRIVPKDYQSEYKPRWRIELGGLGYLEPDNYWPLDKIMHRAGISMAEIPDERGSLILKTNTKPHSPLNHLEYASDFRLMTTVPFPSASAVISSGCYSNLDLCDHAITIAFWFRSESISTDALKSTDSGTSAAPDSIEFLIHNKGESGTVYYIRWRGNRFLNTVFRSSSKRWLLSYAVPPCQPEHSCSSGAKWIHVCITWDNNQLKLYIDGTIEKTVEAKHNEQLASSGASLRLNMLLNTREVKKWSALLSPNDINVVYNETIIDFTIMALDDTGDWKTGIGCTETNGTGPCADQTISETPGENVGPLRYRGSFNDSAVYSDYKCASPFDYDYTGTVSSDDPYGVAIVMGFTVQILDDFNYEQMQSFKVHFTANAGSTQKLNANIYAASSYDFDGKYQSACGMRNFRRDLYYGPVSWSTGQWTLNAVYETPDLMTMLRPLFDRGTLVWRKKFYIIFEWISTPGSTVRLVLNPFPPPYYTFHYKDSKPDKYLYADATLAPHPGYPLQYKTKPIIPVKQCLSFWYHMSGKSIGILSVSVKQEPSIFKEVFRLYGEQGNKWNNAQVPIVGLNMTSYQFQVIFTAIRGETTVGDIAIDTIKFTVNLCHFVPPKAIPQRFISDTFNKTMFELNIPLPRLLLTLYKEQEYFADQNVVVLRNSLTQNLTSDMFGFPLADGYFNDSVIELHASNTIQSSHDFTLLFHVRPHEIRNSTLLWIGNDNLSWLKVGMLSKGQIFLDVHDDSRLLQYNSSINLQHFVWSYVAVVYSKRHQTLTTYLNSTPHDRFSVPNLIRSPTPVKVFVGRGNYQPIPEYFHGHMSCIAFYDSELDSHVITALQLCPSKHVADTCNPRCKADGICNQIRRKCLCPTRASKYVNNDCSNGLRNTIYNTSSDYIDFDSRNLLQRILGHRAYYKDLIAAEKDNLLNVTASYFSTIGPGNLAICTTSTTPIRIKPVEDNCVVNGKCNIKYSISFWALLPSRTKLKDADSFILLTVGSFKMEVVRNRKPRNRNETSSFSIYITVTLNSKRCEWEVSKGIEMHGVWTYYFISIESSTNEISFYQNGNAGLVNRGNCASDGITGNKVLFGGGMPLLCYDEFALWGGAITDTKVMELYNAIKFSGYKQYPSKSINFDRLSFSEKLGSLWALSKEGDVFLYHPDQYWTKVDGKMKSISAGQYGIWAADNSGKIHYRMGITANNPEGTQWKKVDEGSYNSKEVKVISDGFSGTMFFIERTNFKLYCMKVTENGEVSKIANTFHRLSDLTCSRDQCCGYNVERRTYCFGTFTCGSSLPQLTLQEGYYTDHMSFDGVGHLFIVANGVLYRRAQYPAGWALLPINRNLNVKSVLSLNGEPIVITDNGKLVMVGSGDDVIKVTHSGGYCLKLAVDHVTRTKWEIRLKARCDLFRIEKLGCIRHLLSSRFLITGSFGSGLYMKLTNRCEGNSDAFGFKRENFSTISKDGKLLAPFQRKLFPSDIDGVFLYHPKNQLARIFEFYFSPGTIKGEVVISVLVAVHFRDLEYVYSFRDRDGREATSIYRIVETEVKQIFADSNSFIKSEYDEIGYGEEIKFECVFREGCFKQFEIKFKGLLFFSYISIHERNILASNKFNGTVMDCGNRQCRFTLDPLHRQAYITRPAVKIVNRTESSLLFEYQPPEIHGAHTGYLVWLNGISRLRLANSSYAKNFTLHDGLVFNISSLLPYFTYLIAITPLELQTIRSTTYLVGSTLESVPTSGPSIKLLNSSQTWCMFEISSISGEHWNGKLLGYKYFFAKERKLTPEQRLAFNVEDIELYMTKTERPVFSVTKELFSNLDVYTKYIFYFGGFTAVGVGHLTRAECTTKESHPEQFKQNFTVSGINSTHIRITWLPCPDDDAFWNNGDNTSRGYKVFIEEISFPTLWIENGTELHTNHPSGKLVAGPLEEDRMYGIQIAAINNKGDGLKSKEMCFRLSEGVPNGTIQILYVSHNTSTALNLTLGKVELRQENGKVMYYNISLLSNLTGEIEFRIASIDSMVIQSGNVNESMPLMIHKQRTCFNNTFQFGRCSLRPHFINETSYVVNVSIPNLTYWTQYEIKASACTCAGCGPFSDVTYGKTDQHQPTCSTKEITALSTSSTGLNFSWIPLEVNCTHGYPTGYAVFFGSAEAFGGATNFSKDWQISTGTDVHKKHYVVTLQENIHFDGLEKFSNYCIAISGSTVKGFGPISNPVCNRTQEDRPDGPPRNVTLMIGENKTVEVLMKVPTKDKCNGIILGFVVYFSEKQHDYLQFTEYNKTVLRNDSVEGFTRTSIYGLKAYTWYQFETVAFTSIGEGNRPSEVLYILTFEDVPSGEPRNITISNITEHSVTIQWLQVEAVKLNGVFRRFKILINETLVDASKGIWREYFVDRDNIFDISNGSRPFAVKAICNIIEIEKNNTLVLDFDNTSGIFSLSFVGLRPFTNYSISITSCTEPGCGYPSIINIRTEESYPINSPSNLTARNTSESSNLLLTWNHIPILQRNGVIKGYNLKWMKFCHFLSLQHLSTNLSECKRVPELNMSNFEIKFIVSPLLQSVIGNLTPYTRYILRLAAVTDAGSGPESEVLAFTEDDVPGRPPVIRSAFSTSGRSIQIEWLNIPLQYQNGIILGYRVFYHRTDQYNNISYKLNCSSSNHNISACEVRHLDLFTNYTLTIGGFTRKGMGPLANSTIVRSGPYFHGNWSSWGQWSSCSKSCGGGEKIRKRVCNNPAPWNGGDECKGVSSEVSKCNIRRCSGLFPAKAGLDCKTFCKQTGLICNPKMDFKDSAAEFRKAGLICKDKITDSRWNKSYHPAFVEDKGICAGYKSIPEWVHCNATPPFDANIKRLCSCFHQADIGYSEWAPWSYCSKSCGGGKESSVRGCSIPNGCSGSSRQTRDCNTTPCPVDGQWGRWSPMSNCNKTCGYGYQHRYRECDSPAAAYGGEDCYGPSLEYIKGCNPHACPIHGGWSSWETDGICDQACGRGSIVYTRYCDNPKPDLGGEYCKGHNRKAQPCNAHACKGVKVLFWFRLTDFEWNFMFYSLANSVSLQLSAIIRENVLKTYNYSSYISGVQMESFRSSFPKERSRRDISKTYVVANVAVFYSQSSCSQILYLQDYVTTNHMLFKLNVTASSARVTDVLSSPPQNLTGTALDPHTINVTWFAPSNNSVSENATNYYIFYRKIGGIVGQWEIRGIPLTNTSFNLTRLKPRTWYKIRMTISVLDGNGPASNEISIQTLEGVPSESPKNLTLMAIQPTMIYVQWKRIDTYNFHGIPLGYIVKYKNYNEENYHEVRVPHEVSDVTLVGLKPFTAYVVTVCGYTAVGNGPRTSSVGKTLEGVPSEPPLDVRVKQRVSLDTIIVTWNALNEEVTNGRFKGYKVRYTMRKVAGVDVMVTESSRKEIVVDKYTLRLKISGLLSYASYDVSVCGFTEAGNGPFSKPILGETCKCPDNIFMNWYESRPYLIKDSNGTVSGIFKEIADGMIKTSCGACNGILPMINYYISYSGESAEKTSELNVKDRIENGYHMSFPIFGRSEMRHFMNNHIFMELVRSPGSAVIVNGAIDYTGKTINAFKSIIKIWPMILIILLISLLFGILLWSVEQFYNNEFSRGMYLKGMCQGLWWAFVTMTTVGYGDITPRSVPGRVVAMIWTLVGLVLVGILTGALTSTVTTLTVPPSPKLYDTNTAVINNSFDHSLAIRRNARVEKDMQFSTANDVLLALHHKKVEVALLDAFVTAAQKSSLTNMELQVKKVISANTAYGFVLSKEFIRLENDFKSHIASNQDRITQFISNMTNMLQTSDNKPPNIQLFDPNTPAFWIVLKFELSLLAVLIFVGVIWTVVLKCRRRHKVGVARSYSLEMVDSFEDMIKSFHQRVEERSRFLANQHTENLLDLINIKKSLKGGPRGSRQSNSLSPN